MPKQRYQRKAPTHDWEQIRPLLKDPAQITEARNRKGTRHPAQALARPRDVAKDELGPGTHSEIQPETDRVGQAEKRR